MQLTTQTYQKIGVVYGILVILVVLALGVRFWQGRNYQNITNMVTKKTAVVNTFSGRYSVITNSTTFKVGDSIDLTLVFEAPGKLLDGTDVVLRFNPSVISALGFTPGTYFNLVPRKDVDNSAGTVKITSLDAVSNQPLKDKVALGVVHFQAVKAGTTEVNFDFTAGTTSKTTLTQRGTSLNILGSVAGITITVVP